MTDVIIFGNSDTAQLANFYLNYDSEHRVVGFSVNRKYLDGLTEFEGLPIVRFEDVERIYDPQKYFFFAPMTGKKNNKLRESIYYEIKEKGYELISYVSSKATVFPEAQIGENCFILEDNTIQPFTTIGNNVVLWSGNHIGHHGTINDHVFFTSHVVLSGHCIVEPYSFFGVNATIRNNLTIREGTVLGMGACLTKNTDPWSVYIGNPAKKLEISSHDVAL
jgi:sugar O-acyltransferase (sialic acid O-acetyltransferase NeuD family)